MVLHNVHLYFSFYLQGLLLCKHSWGIIGYQHYELCLPWWFSGKESACNAGVSGSIPGLGKSHWEGNSNTLRYSCLGNPMDRGAWRAIVRGHKSRAGTWLTKTTIMNSNIIKSPLFLFKNLFIFYLILDLIDWFVGFFFPIKFSHFIRLCLNVTFWVGFPRYVLCPFNMFQTFGFSLNSRMIFILYNRLQYLFCSIALVSFVNASYT